MSHFVDCVLDDEEPLATGEEGRGVLEIILAAYESAATGRRVEWPWEAERDRTGAEVWER
jgi:myo-inositol 2-dehydrogenase / D-chiro-inositol 1-dehydrogenase